MNRIEIIVNGPTASGKSIVVDAIARALAEIKANILSEDLETERNLRGSYKFSDEEIKDFQERSYIVLREVNISRQTT